MTKIYLVKNQQLYLAKDGQWLEAKEKRKLFFTPHHDVALNTLLETNSQQIDLRLEVFQTELNEQNLPKLET